MSEESAVVGLTGGIGSGKSTVVTMFSDLGVPVLDLDRVGHEMVAGNSAVQEGLIHVFGSEICNDDKKIDRRKLAEKAFVSEEATATLNAIVHPAIRAEQLSWLSRQSAPYALIEASVLIESGGVGRVDRLVVVMAQESIRRQRVLARSNFIDAAMFESIVARQCDDATRLSHADHIIKNNGSISELNMQVKALHTELKAQFAG